MKSFALICTLCLSTAVFALPEDFSFSGDVKIAGKHTNKRSEEEAAHASWQKEDKANIEATFMANVKQDLGWAAAKVKVANNVGTVSASDAITLQKALVGSNFYENGASRWYGELGRQPLSDHFESAVQFNRDFDGVYTEFSRPLGWAGTYVAQGGPMVIEVNDQKFGYVAMTGFDGIGGSGAYTRVSITGWDAHYQPVQLLAGYRFKGFWVIPNGRTYAAYILNPGVGTRRQAGYIGMQIGNIQKKGDWSVKTELRAVESNALFKSDAAGTNFWGPLAEVGYAFTDNFSARLKGQHSTRLSSKIPGDHASNLIEGKLILAF